MAKRGVIRQAEMKERRRGGRESLGEDGPLIGLHNIDSITDEFFAALRASTLSAIGSEEGGKERDKRC